MPKRALVDIEAEIELRVEERIKDVFRGTTSPPMPLILVTISSYYKTDRIAVERALSHLKLKGWAVLVQYSCYPTKIQAIVPHNAVDHITLRSVSKKISKIIDRF